MGPGPFWETATAPSSIIWWKTSWPIVWNNPDLNFSARVGDALQLLKEFNREHIYKNMRVKKQTSKVKLMFSLLFEKLYEDLEQNGEASVIYTEFLKGMSEGYRAKTPAAGMVRDFIAGMTDEFFMDQCHKHLIPKRTHSLF